MICLSRRVRFKCGDYALLSSRTDARFSIHLILWFFSYVSLVFQVIPK